MGHLVYLIAEGHEGSGSGKSRFHRPVELQLQQLSKNHVHDPVLTVLGPSMHRPYYEFEDACSREKVGLIRNQTLMQSASPEGLAFCTWSPKRSTNRYDFILSSIHRPFNPEDFRLTWTHDEKNGWLLVRAQLPGLHDGELVAKLTDTKLEIQFGSISATSRGLRLLQLIQMSAMYITLSERQVSNSLESKGRAMTEPLLHSHSVFLNLVHRVFVK